MSRSKRGLIIGSSFAFILIVSLTIYYLDQQTPVKQTSKIDKDIHIEFVLLDNMHPAIHLEKNPPYYLMEKVNGVIRQASYDGNDVYSLSPDATNYYLKVYPNYWVDGSDEIMVNETLFVNSPHFIKEFEQNYTHVFEMNKTIIDEELNFSNNGLGIPAYSLFYFYDKNPIDTMNCKQLQQYVKGHISDTNDQLTQLARDLILTSCISSKNMTMENQN